MHKQTFSINNLNQTNTNNASSNINNYENTKQSHDKNQTLNKDTTRENFYKEIRDSESNYANKDNENLLRKSTDFYFLPKIKHRNKNENYLSNNNNNDGKRINLFKNKTIVINNSNLNFGYLKNEINTINTNEHNNNKLNNENLVENHNNTHNNFNTNMTHTINTTDSHSNTFFYNPKLRHSTSFKNYNFIDESYYYRFKTSPRKNMITTNFNNTSNNNNNNNMKTNNNNDNNSISVSQKKLDFKSIIENEKVEEEKRLQQFFQKLNMSSINNFPNARGVNIHNSNNPNLKATQANYNNNHTIYKNNNTELNEKENKTFNNIYSKHIKDYSDNVKSNSENKKKSQENLKLKNQTTKNSSVNSLLYKKENNKRNTQSSNNLNYNILNQINNYMILAPKNNFDAIRPLMTKPTENVLNSVDTIKNRNKIKIINKKLQISKEIPMQSYMITNIKPPCLFDFNNKLKGKVVLKKETELQKIRNLKTNPEAYYEDEEMEFNNENDSEKNKDGKEPFFKKIGESSYREMKSELQQQEKQLSAFNDQSKKSNEKSYNASNGNSNFPENKENENTCSNEKGIILNYLEKKEKKSVRSIVNNPQQQIAASVDNSFTLRNSEQNYFLNQNLNDISENGCSSDLNSSFKNENNRDIKAEFQRKFESHEKMRLMNSQQNINFKNESNYFYEKDEESHQAFNSSRKVSAEKNNLGAFPARRHTENSHSEPESLEESVGSIHEDKIHNLDDSGILQIKRHESLYIKAHRKFSKGNQNFKHLASTLSFKHAGISPEKQRPTENPDTPVIQLNPVLPVQASTSNNTQGLNFINNVNSNSNNKNIDINLITNSNNTKHNYFSSNKNTSNPSFNLNLNTNPQNQTIGSSLFKRHEAAKSPGISNNMLNFNRSYAMNSTNNNFNDNNNEEEAATDLAQHDFEPHEVEPNLKTKTEIDKIKNQINNLKKKQFNFKNDFLNDVHKRLQKKAFEINPDYQSTKDIFLKYRQEKVLEKTDFNISSRLHLQNRNPIFQINNMISFPLMIDDPVFLANIYNVNMYKIETTAKNKFNKV